MNLLDKHSLDSSINSENTFILEQLLFMTIHQDFADQMGRDKMKDMLESFLEKMELEDKVLQVCCKTLDACLGQGYPPYPTYYRNEFDLINAH